MGASLEAHHRGWGGPSLGDDGVRIGLGETLKIKLPRPNAAHFSANWQSVILNAHQF